MTDKWNKIIKNKYNIWKAVRRSYFNPRIWCTGSRLSEQPIYKYFGWWISPNLVKKWGSASFFSFTQLRLFISNCWTFESWWPSLNELKLHFVKCGEVLNDLVQYAPPHRQPVLVDDMALLWNETTLLQKPRLIAVKYVFMITTKEINYDAWSSLWSC